MVTRKLLLEQFLSEENFLRAYRRIASKGASGGIDGVSVEELGRHLRKNIKWLIEQIRSGSYIPHPVTTVYIPKFKEEDEWRRLGLPTVADKLVQAALLQVVEPLAEEIFLDTNYGYRPGKGPHKALRRVEHNLQYERKQWVVRRDIDSFFDTLDYERLLTQFFELVKGEPVLTELVALWCRMGLVERDGRWQNVKAGVRQGQIIAPLLANLYLHPLDEFVNTLRVGWVRYGDDYILQCNSKAVAESLDIQVIDFLKEVLSLKVNDNSNPVLHIEDGFTFLGVHFCGEKRSIDRGKMKIIEQKISYLFSKKDLTTPEDIILV